MFLTIDIGNTNIVAGIYEKKRLISHFRAETNKKNCRRIFTDFLGDCSSFLKKKRAASIIEGVAISSVVPSLDKIFEVQAKRINKKVFFIDHKVNLGMKIEVDKPSQVGADRLVNVVAGKIIYGAPVIIIDFGTATTIDVVNKEGNYIGGIIAPGIGLGAHALFTGTAKLPVVELKKPKKIIGKNTIECIQSGLIYGSIGSIELFVKLIRNELKYKAKVIATGGLVNLIVKETKIMDHVDEFLTLHGIRIVYEINK